MVTLVLYAVVALVVMSALVALAVVVLPATEQLADAPADRTPWQLPAEDRPLVEPDVAGVRLPVALRGYRFAETDAVLDRLGTEIAQRDERINSLQAELSRRAAPTSPTGPVKPVAPAKPVEPVAPAGPEAP